jgi:hypothetical protein
MVNFFNLSRAFCLPEIFFQTDNSKSRVSYIFYQENLSHDYSFNTEHLSRDVKFSS